MGLRLFLYLTTGSYTILLVVFWLLRPVVEAALLLQVLLSAGLGMGILSAVLGFWLERFKNLEEKKIKQELEEKAEALSQLRQLRTLLVAANDRLSRRLFENKVMLTIWSEQEKAHDTKEFLAHLLETLLPGVPFEYGCVIIRPSLADPEFLFAKNLGDSSNLTALAGEAEGESQKMLWIEEIDPEVKNFLLHSGQESRSGKVLSLERTKGNLEGKKIEEIAVLTLALRQGNDHLGSLHLLTHREMPRIGSSLQTFLMNVRSQLAVLLQIRALSFAMRVDPLTRLYNRGYLNERLREETLRSSRTNRPFSFLMLDVDHFKKVNDTFGHQAGDSVLIALANLLKKNCRASDAICRYGGEEIGILLVDTPLGGAQIFAENLRRAVEEEIFLHENIPIRITVSIGLAESSKEGSPESLVQEADTALYAAKNAGRNTWRVRNRST